MVISPITKLVWIDLEMTGLMPSKNTILEIACVITNQNFEPIDQPISRVIAQPPAILDQMDDWNKKHHAQSGLLEAVKQSQTTLAQAEEQILTLLQKHCKPQEAPLCGNSVWVDRLFLQTYMPKLEKYLHYRVLDVSSIKILAGIWFGITPDDIKKQKNHRALDDIHESIVELIWYHQHIFKQDQNNI